MAEITFKLTNHVTETVELDTEIVAIGFINNGEAFEILNNISVTYAELTTEEKAIADDFITMMRAKVLDGSGAS